VSWHFTKGRGSRHHYRHRSGRVFISAYQSSLLQDLQQDKLLMGGLLATLALFPSRESRNPQPAKRAGIKIFELYPLFAGAYLPLNRRQKYPKP